MSRSTVRSRSRLLASLAAASLLGVACAPAIAAPDKPAQTAKTAPAQPSAGKPKPSGILKAYKGPEGELIVMVEVNEGKEMLVYLKKIGGDLDGKALLYLLEDRGDGDKDVFFNKKRGSKWYRSHLLSARSNQWAFYHPTDGKIQLQLRYSEAASESTKLDEVLAAYKP